MIVICGKCGRLYENHEVSSECPHGAGYNGLIDGKKYIIIQEVYQRQVAGYWFDTKSHFVTRGGNVPLDEITEVRGPIGFDSLPIVYKKDGNPLATKT